MFISKLTNEITVDIQQCFGVISSILCCRNKSEDSSDKTSEIVGADQQDNNQVSATVAEAYAPALANAALLAAKGCPNKYVSVLRELYHANNLPCPENFQPLFDALENVDDNAVDLSNLATEELEQPTFLHDMEELLEEFHTPSQSTTTLDGNISELEGWFSKYSMKSNNSRVKPNTPRIRNSLHGASTVSRSSTPMSPHCSVMSKVSRTQSTKSYIAPSTPGTPITRPRCGVSMLGTPRRPSTAGRDIPSSPFGAASPRRTHIPTMDVSSSMVSLNVIGTPKMGRSFYEPSANIVRRTPISKRV